MQGREVVYEADGTTLKGYIAYDDAHQGQAPGGAGGARVVGAKRICAQTRAHAGRELGYTALAVDMYGNGKVVDNPDDAGKLVGEVYKDMPMAKARFEAAMQLLREQETVEANELPRSAIASAAAWC